MLNFNTVYQVSSDALRSRFVALGCYINEGTLTMTIPGIDVRQLKITDGLDDGDATILESPMGPDKSARYTFKPLTLERLGEMTDREVSGLDDLMRGLKSDMDVWEYYTTNFLYPGYVDYYRSVRDATDE
jgi:hypothetical protein